MPNCIWQATECLIELGADVNIGEGSSTPLYIAVCSEREDVVRLIIKQVHFFTVWLDAFEMNSLPNNKILGLPKLKAFADDKINVTQKLKFALGRGRKHCGKRRKCWLPAFSPFPTMFSQASFSGSLKVEIMWLRVKLWIIYR